MLIIVIKQLVLQLVFNHIDHLDCLFNVRFNKTVHEIIFSYTWFDWSMRSQEPNTSDGIEMVWNGVACDEQENFSLFINQLNWYINSIFKSRSFESRTFRTQTHWWCEKEWQNRIAKNKTIYKQRKSKE